MEEWVEGEWVVATFGTHLEVQGVEVGVGVEVGKQVQATNPNFLWLTC